jgi:hypothetical protein
MNQYVVADLSWRVMGFIEADEPPEMEDRLIAEMPDPVSHWPDAPYPEAELIFSGGSLQWHDPRQVAGVEAKSIAAIDADADAARMLAIGDPGRPLEYLQAEAAARAWYAAAYAGTAPKDVASWANAKEWTNQQAADDIIATADRWRDALSEIRRLRLMAKETIRRIAADPDGTNAEIDAILSAFQSDLSALMQGVP